MAVPNSNAVQTHEASSNSEATQLHSWNHLSKGCEGLEGVITLFRGPSIFIGSGADADLILLAAVACSQAAVGGWKTLRSVDCDKAWIPPGDGAVTSFLSHLLRQARTVELVFRVTWNLRDDLLCKNYFRFLLREVCYPYNKETKDEWFTAEITRQEEVNGKNTDEKYEVEALNSTDKSLNELSEEETKYLKVDSKPGYWFHGTSHTSAVNILEGGINLKKGNKRQDFSDDRGFYMSPKFTSAKYWAKNHRKPAAVIVFNVRDQLEDEKHHGLDLTGNDKVADWGVVVKHNRSGRKRYAPMTGELLKRYNKCDYIVGPMSGGEQTRCPLEEEACKRWRPQLDSALRNQLCIRTERLADVLGNLKDKHIEAVVFYGD